MFKIQKSNFNTFLFRHKSNDSGVSDSLTRDLRLIRKRKQEDLQNNGGQDLQLHQTPTKLMRPLLPLADPNVLEESKTIGRNQHSTRLSEDNKIVSRSQSLEEKPLVSGKYCTNLHALCFLNPNFNKCGSENKIHRIIV